MKKSDWWIQGKPYGCNQCGKVCYQGVLHKCRMALPVARVHKTPMDAASRAFDERLAKGFAMPNGEGD